MTRWFLVALIVVSDQLTKWAVYTFMVPAQSLPLLPPVLHLTYVQNTGGAFGLFQGHPWAFVVVSLIVGGWVMIELSRGRHQARSTQVALAAILGGAIGNLVDRLRLGYVVDFLDLRVWPVFNVADSCITLGVCWLLLQALVGGTGHGARGTGHV